MVHLKETALFLVGITLVASAAALVTIDGAYDVSAQGSNMTGNMTKSNDNTTAASDPGSGNISGLLLGDGT